MKKDIFNGKIKKEYFSYILVYMIFMTLFFGGIGGLCLYVAISGMTGDAFGGLFIFSLFGVVGSIFAVLCSVGEMIVIRNFPKHKWLRRILFNSDIYFTESDSDEYRGRRRRRDIAAFKRVTSMAEAEKRMGGKKKPIKYTVYCALMLLMSVLGLAVLFVVPLLYEKGIVFQTMSDDVFAFCYISGAVICIILAFVFLGLAYKTALMVPFENDK